MVVDDSEVSTTALQQEGQQEGLQGDIITATENHSETSSLLSCALILGAIFKDIENQEEAAQIAQDFTGMEPKAALKACGKALGLTCKIKRAKLNTIAESQLPIAARTNTGLWFVLAKLSDDGALIQRPGQSQPDVV